jgi:hypothetical protein
MATQYHYTPGHVVDVEVLADSNGDVADEGQGVAVVGEAPDGPQVELVEGTDAAFVGLLKNTPEDLRDRNSSEADFAAGDSVGRATVILGVHVLWMPTDDGYDPSPGDLVEVGDGGDIEAYGGPTTTGIDAAVTNDLGIDDNGTLENGSANDINIALGHDAFPDGSVFTTIAREWGVGGRTAVIITGGL